MNDRHFQKWQKMRAKGKGRFILIRGLLAWGLPMFMIMTFVANKPASGQMSPGMIALNAFIWAIAGLVFGYFTWAVSERAYQKVLQSRENAITSLPE
ncbi:MAG: hypothetical protein U0997_08660 [Sulfurimicrobium sp.]|jgi:hypothetical protein|nr:hypothetical protein [Sulfurimicrobium sp.]